MPDAESLTVEILREIRDGVRGTNEKIDQTNSRLDQTNSRLDQTNSRLDQTNFRLDKVEEVLRDLAGQFVILGRYVKNVSGRHDKAIEDLRRRVSLIEGKGNGGRRPSRR